MDRRTALITAGRTRLRPIMMTTVAMIFGMLPLALALGQGAEMRAPMARAVIGGLITSTMLTLLVVPVVYTLLDDFAQWLHRRMVGAQFEAHEVAKGAAAVLLVAGADGPGGTAGARRGGAAQDRHARGGPQDRQRAEPRHPEGPRVRQLGAGQVRRGQGLGVPAPLARRRRDALLRREPAGLPQGPARGLRASSRSSRTSRPGRSPSPSRSSPGARSAPRSAAPSSAWRPPRTSSALTARQVTRRDVTAAFYDVLLARELLAIAEQDVALEAEAPRRGARRIDAGVATDYDVLAAG